MAKHRRRKSSRYSRRDTPRPKPVHFDTYAEAQAVVKKEKLHVQEVVRTGGGLRINVVETDKRAKPRTLYVRAATEAPAA